jgi:hypothetical protein
MHIYLYTLCEFKTYLPEVVQLDMIKPTAELGYRQAEAWHSLIVIHAMTIKE